MGHRRNPILQWTLSSLAISFARLTACLPLTLARYLGCFLGSIAYYAIPRIRKVGIQNLDLAYGRNMSLSQKIQTLKKAAQNVGIVASEFSHISKLHGDYLQRYTKTKGLELLDKNSGTLLIGSHFANWEWAAPILSSLGHKVAGVVRPLDDPRLDSFIDSTRRSCGVHTISKHNAAQEIIKLLREGWIVGVLIDQSPRENGVPVTFFDQPCWGTIAPVMAAIRARVPIHPFSIVRDEKGDYTFSLHPAIDICKSGNLLEDLVKNTQLCQNAIETIIRDRPEQWLWLHRRWKPRPNLNREWQARIDRDKKTLKD